MPSFTITLTDADTNYNVLALVRAVDSDFVDQSRQVSISSDFDNDSENNVLGGDSHLDVTRYGWELAPGDSFTTPRHTTLLGTWVRSAAAAQVLHVEVTR